MASRLAPRGFLAVDLFFLLSGLVLAFSYDKRLTTDLTFKDFFAARIIRLYPIFILGMSLAVLIQVVILHTQNHNSDSRLKVSVGILMGFFFIPDFFHSGGSYLFPMNNPAWSLLCELLANLTYALLVCLRFARTLILILLSMLSLTTLFSWAFLVSGTFDGGYSFSTVGFGIARVGWSFFAGVLLHRYLFLNKKPLFTGPAAWLSSSVVLLTVVLALSTPLTQSAFAQAITVTAIFPLVVYFGARTSLPSLLTKVAVFLGDVSYPIYLFHWPLLSIFAGRTYKRLSSLHPIASQFVFPAFLTGIVFLSWLLSRAYDRPLRKWLTARYNSSSRQG